MANNIFTSAIKGAQLSVRVNNDGGRFVDRGPPFRGGGNGGGRWQRGGGGFRGNRGGGGFRGRGRGRGPRRGGRGGRGGYNNSDGQDDIDDDGDANMDSSYGAFGGGGNRDRRRERSPDNSRCDWKVTIVDGRKHNREWLMNRLSQQCDGHINPKGWKFMGSDVMFFIDDDRIASSLEDANNRITQKDGTKIQIRVASTKGGSGVSNNSAASTNNSQAEMEALRICLGHRYDAALNKLDLSKMSSDSMLRGFPPKVDQVQYMKKILDLIHALCPTLKVLDLSNNRIVRLENLANLHEKCPELEELILSYNDIRFTGELLKIANHKNIKTLWFVGNPGQLQYSADKTKYMADVRRRLPHLLKLDDAILPKEVKFTLEDEDTEEAGIPERHDTFAADAKDFELVKSFIQNYFAVYDGDRQNLLPAYHNDATFSLCCNSTITAKASASTSLAYYIKHSRNIRNIQGSKQKRMSLLKNKKLNIVAFLNELPKSQHWMESLSLDLTFTTERMLIFTVMGVFIEGADELKKPRGFARTFIAQREEGGGFLVVNDQLHIRNLTNNQSDLLEEAKKTLEQPAAVPEEVQLSDAHKEMITRFCAESKMNLMYSKMCLEAAGWDYKEAGAKFMEFHAAGTIPAEAFQ